jgi:hypothetical protein
MAAPLREMGFLIQAAVLAKAQRRNGSKGKTTAMAPHISQRPLFWPPTVQVRDRPESIPLLPPDRTAVFARVRSCEERARLRIDHYRLITAEQTWRDRQLVALCFERLPHLGSDRRFERESAVEVSEARLLARPLNVHPEINDVEQNLDVPLRLHVAAHHAEREPGLAVFEDHRGNDRVKGAFAAFEPIGRFLVERKSRAAIVQDDPGVARDQTRSERAEDALDE